MQLASRDTLRELTGLRRPSAIAQHLRRLGLHYASGADGWPRVALSAIERLLDPPGHVRDAEVDVSAMADLRRRK